MGGYKKCTKKTSKNTILCKTSNAADPAKNDVKRSKIEPTMLDFFPGAERAPPAHRAG